MESLEWVHKISDKVRYYDMKFPRQPKESDDGNREYKWFLCPNNHKPNKVATQLQYRLAEGGGKAVYIIGIMDDGTPMGSNHLNMNKSLGILHKASLIITGTQINTVNIYGSINNCVATIRLSNNKLKNKLVWCY